MTKHSRDDLIRLLGIEYKRDEMDAYDRAAWRVVGFAEAYIWAGEHHLDTFEAIAFGHLKGAVNDLRRAEPERLAAIDAAVEDLAYQPLKAAS